MPPSYYTPLKHLQTHTAMGWRNPKPHSHLLRTCRKRDISQCFTGVISSEAVAVGWRSTRAPRMLRMLLQVADAVCFSFSAERHAGCPCVTASMDDIYFEHTIR